MPKIKLSSADLKKQMDRQISILKSHINTYFNNPDIALDIATKIRLFVHDTKRQTSLLSSLKLKNRLFPSTYSTISQGNNAPYAGLVYVYLDWDGGGFIPKLNKTPIGVKNRLLTFESWWNEMVIRDYKGRKLSRKDLVLEAANTDGGAHVDDSLNENYHFVSRQHSLTWKYIKLGNDPIPIWGVELASICQIGYELITFLESNYTPPEPPKHDMVVELAVQGQLGMEMFGKPLPFTLRMEHHKPNEDDISTLCKCGSGISTQACYDQKRTVVLTTEPF